ncbi:hypothetical protein SLA2020_183150 [Shorea laevis]
MKFGTNNQCHPSHFKSNPNHIGFFKFLNAAATSLKKLIADIFLPFGVIVYVIPGDSLLADGGNGDDEEENEDYNVD